MSDDPFAEPSDAERTLVRPRVSVARPPSAGRFNPREREIRPVPKTGTNPLVAAAAPVLAAAMRIGGNSRAAPDVDQLRGAMVGAMRRFETEALATGMDTRSLRAARYALCATVDDLVLSTPWGATSSWAQQSMTSIFHNEVTGGERFFEILEQMQRDLGHHEPVVELMYLCLSLGFAGRYRVVSRGGAEIAELRDGVYRTIRQRRGDFERELSPHWRGLAAAARAHRARVPLWAVGLGTASIAAAMFVGFSLLLASTSNVAFAELFALPPRDVVAIPHPPMQLPAVSQPATVPVAASAAVAKLRTFLAPEIKAGLVQVMQTPQAVTVRLTNGTMFGSGAATLGASYAPLLGRIGEALNDEAGKITVVGYTDDQPIRTARFPSNFELSQARADAVAALLRAHLTQPNRVQAQGKGAAEPLVSNATAEGRQQNRRTEIILVRTPDAT
jgi:type VI secretion system protein ImpK